MKEFFVITIAICGICAHGAYAAIAPSNVLCDVCAEYLNCLQSECDTYAAEESWYDSDDIVNTANYCRDEAHYSLDSKSYLSASTIDNYLTSHEMADQLVYDIMGGGFIYQCTTGYCEWLDLFRGCTNNHTNVCSCPAGYYLYYNGNTSNSSVRTTECRPCPDGGLTKTGLSYAGSTMETCYLPQDTTRSDTTGEYVYTNDCYYER